MSSSTAEAAVLTTVRHVTAKKWDKADARLKSFKYHLSNVESSLKYKQGESGLPELESDIVMLLATVREAFAGSLDTQVDARSAWATRYSQHGASLKLPGTTEKLSQRLDAIQRMLWEAKYSAGFSMSAMLAWRNELLSILRQGHHRMVYTSLFGHLTNEWAELRFGELSTAKARKTQEPQASAAGGDLINTFLNDLFQSGAQQKEQSDGEPLDLRTNLLQGVRSKIASGCGRGLKVTTNMVKDAVQAVLSADQLTSEKRRAMHDISNKDNVLSEIAGLLNIDANLDSLNRWSWDAEPISAEMRKAINGKYRVYLDLELLDAILIQCLGKFISVEIKEALSTAWECPTDSVWQPKPDESREVALEKHIHNHDKHRSKTSVQKLRQTIYENSFFAVGLPDEADNDLDWYDNDRDKNKDDQLQDLTHGSTSRASLRTDILRLCSAEMAVQKLTHGQFCILQSDFEWFGPSLPHSTLIAIMEYFHFPQELVHFVQSFLNMSMKFDEDGPNGSSVLRKAGIPVSFQITDGISELLLFVLDFAVNQRTNGSFIYRNHDDLWFWGQPEECAAAWEVMREFTEVMGMRLNNDKTGFAHAVDESNPRRVSADQQVLERLPSGDVKWGFLLFDAREWKWTANKPAIKEHMGELRFQLKSRTAVMAHIEAYNAYIRKFLPNNFGQVIVGLGESHPVMVLEALKYALQCLYGDEDSSDAAAKNPRVSSAAEHVRRMIQENFGGDYTVPDCFLYMPVDSGGLGLANPVPAFAKYVEIYPERITERSSDDALSATTALKTMMTEVSAAYREDLDRFKDRRRKRAKAYEKSANKHGAETELAHDTLVERLLAASEFMSFSDYLATAEVHSSDLHDMYKALLEEPAVKNNRRTSSRWALDMFHDDLEELFGGHIAEDEFLSLGLYRALAEERVRWEG